MVAILFAVLLAYRGVRSFWVGGPVGCPVSSSDHGADGPVVCGSYDPVLRRYLGFVGASTPVTLCLGQDGAIVPGCHDGAAEPLGYSVARPLHIYEVMNKREMRIIERTASDAVRAFGLSNTEARGELRLRFPRPLGHPERMYLYERMRHERRRLAERLAQRPQ